MSEPTPPPERTQEPAEGKKKNLLTRKIGPLPTWVWIIIVAAIILVWVVWKNSQAKKKGKGKGFRPGGAAPRFVGQRHRHPHPPGAPDEQTFDPGAGSAAMAAPASDKDISSSSNALWHPMPPGVRKPPDDDDDRQPQGPMPPQPVWQT